MVESPAYFPPQTNMVAWKIHHLRKCISYWKWGIFHCHLDFFGGTIPASRNLRSPWFPIHVSKSWDDLPDAVADENPRDTDMLRALLTASFSDRLLTSSRKHSEVGAVKVSGKWRSGLLWPFFKKFSVAVLKGFSRGFLLQIYIYNWMMVSNIFFSPLFGKQITFFFLNIFQMGGINPPTRKRYLPQEETWWLFLLQSTVFSLRKMTWRVVNITFFVPGVSKVTIWSPSWMWLNHLQRSHFNI